MLSSLLSRLPARVGLLAGLTLCLSSAAQAQLSQLVISEAFGGGHQSTETPNADYVEIYNRGPNAVSLNGLSVQVATSTGAWQVIPLNNVLLPARQYYLVQTEPDTTPGIDFIADQTSGTAFSQMTSANGKCALVNGVTALSGSGCPISYIPGGTVIDMLGFGTATGWEPCSGSKGPSGSIVSGNILSVTRKSGGCQDTNNNFNDFEAVAPSPTKSGVTQPLVREFTGSLSPATSVSGAGQLVTITAFLRDCATPVTGATVSAGLGGFSLGTLFMFDDGLHSDGVINDGVYGGTFNVPLGQSAGNVDVQVSYVKDATSGNFNVSHLVYAAPPVNDLCDNAIEVSGPLNAGSTYSESVTNTSATADIDVGTCNTDSSTRFGFWYTFTPTNNGVLQLVETGNQDVVYGVFTFTNAASQCTTLVSSACLAGETSSATLTAGVRYYLLVGNQTAVAATAPPTDPLDLTFAYTPAPANDVCTGATDMSTTLNSNAQYTDSINAIGATFDADVTCNSSTASTWAGVWYKFTPATNGAISVVHNGSPDTIRNIYSGTCGSLTSLICTDDPDTTPSIAAVTAGSTYYVLVGNYASSQPTANYDIAVDFIPPPGNDSCANATLIGGFPYTDAPYAPSAGPDQDVGCNSGTATSLLSGVWYTFTASGNGSVAVTEASTADTVRAAYTGANCGSLSEVACADAETLTFSVTNGTVYWVVCGQYSATASAAVPYDLSFEFITPPSNDLCGGAIPVDLSSAFTDASDGRGATADADAGCNGTATESVAGVWYSFTTGLDGGILSVNESSAASSAWTLYTGNCAGLTEVACSANDLTTFTLAHSTSYRLLLSSDSATVPTIPYAVAISFTASTGGCCQGTSCSAMTRSACLGASGSYLGDAASCGPPAGMPQTFSGGTNIPYTITDNSTGTSAITVAPSFPLGAVSVQIDIVHSYVSDIVLSISNGTVTADLHKGDGFLSANMDGIYTFSDTGSQTWDTAATGLATGDILPPATYQAATTGNVAVSLNSAFSGQSSAGTWTLTLQDDATIDTGTLRGWSIILDGIGTPPCNVGPTPCQQADFDDNNAVSVNDLFAFLSAWFAQNGQTGSGLSADIDGNNAVSVNDLFSFLSLWFQFNGQTC